jgi:hypothetical protein
MLKLTASCKGLQMYCLGFISPGTNHWWFPDSGTFRTGFKTWLGLHRVGTSQIKGPVQVDSENFRTVLVFRALRSRPDEYPESSVHPDLNFQWDRQTWTAGIPSRTELFGTVSVNPKW